MLRPHHEGFLHFIWYYQYYDQKKLLTTSGEAITVLNLGFMNTDAGPDFAEGVVQIGNETWVGDIEIHILAGDWAQHKHQHDRAYNKVILHVVWEDNKEVRREDATLMPTLELKGRVDASLLDKYRTLFYQQDFILCQNHWDDISLLKKIALMDRALFHRLERKARLVTEIWEQMDQDWEQTAFVLLVKSFGMKVNQLAFQALAENLPIKVLYKHKNQLLQIEALLFGQASFLEEEGNNEYYKSLRNEFLFLKQKYKLDPIASMHWKFSRLRPYNFPTVRLAQLAKVMCDARTLFSRLINFEDPKELLTLLDISPSEYWKTHYMFEKKIQKNTSGIIGQGTQHSILINTVAPLLVAYAHHKNDFTYQDKAIALLESLPKETNKITKKWKEVGLKSSNAFDSQAMLEQYQFFCQKQLCLKCPIGTSILRQV